MDTDNECRCGEEGYYRPSFAATLCEECFVQHADGASQRREEGYDWE